MDDIVDASNELRDNNPVTNASENDPLDKVASVLQLAEQPEFDAASKKIVSEGSSDLTKKRSRKKIKKKVDVINEIQCTCMRQTEMNIKITDKVNDNMGASDNVSRVVNNESEKNRSAKDVPVLKLAEHPELDDGLMEKASEGTLGTEKKRKRKKEKKKVNVPNEVQSMDPMLLNAGTMDNLTQIVDLRDGTLEASGDVRDYNAVTKNFEMNLLHKDATALPLTEISNIDAASTENPSGVITDTKRINRRNRKKVNAKNDFQSMDQEMTEHLAGTNDQMDESAQAPEQVRDCNVVNNVSEKNLIYVVNNEVQNMDQMLVNAGAMENLTAIVNQRDGTLEASGDVRDYNAVTENLEMNLLHKDVTGFPLTEHSNTDAPSTTNPARVNTDTKKIKRRNRKKVNAENEIQSMDQEMTEHLAETNNRMDDSAQATEQVRDCNVVNNEFEKNLIYVVNNEVQNMDQMLLNAGTMENLTAIIDQRDGSLEASRGVRDYNAVAKNFEMNLLHKDATGLPLTEHSEFDAASTTNSSGVNTDTKKIKRQKRKKVNAKNEIQSMDQEMTEHLAETNDRMDLSAQAPQQIRDCNVVSNESEKHLINKDATVLPLSEHPKLEAGSTDSVLEHNIEANKRKRRKKNMKVKVMNEFQSMGEMEMNMGTAENLTEIKYQLDDHVEHADKLRNFACSIVNNESENKFHDKDATLPLVAEHSRLEAWSIKNASEGNMDKKVNVSNEVLTMDKGDMNIMTTESLAQIMACGKRKRINKKNKKKAKSEIESMNPADAMYKILLPAESMNPADAMYKILLPAKNLVAGTDKLVNVVNEVNNDIFTGRQKYATEDGGILSPSNVEITKPIASPDEKEDKYLSERLGEHPKIELGAPIRRKLLVLDVNGLLADIVKPAPKHRRGDVHILQRAIFRRPFCSDFLNFCFQNFDVGIWSSRSKVIIDRVVGYLLGYRKDKLLFCWNMSHATQTGRRTLENIHKPLVFKELSKIWENNLPDSRWKKGDYDESNTLLLDDSPYKALLNPPHTAIFPSSFHYGDRYDNSLGPGGDLRVYLERLLACDNVQKYVEQNPFGQGAINEKNPSWEFYSGILCAMTNRFNDNCSSSLPMSSQG